MKRVILKYEKGRLILKYEKGNFKIWKGLILKYEKVYSQN